MGKKFLNNYFCYLPSSKEHLNVEQKPQVMNSTPVSVKCTYISSETKSFK